MKLKKLFKNLKKCKPHRKEFHMKPSIRIAVDDNHYTFSFLPTVVYEPWIYRYPNLQEPLLDIWWLNIHILIGTWKKREET